MIGDQVVAHAVPRQSPSVNDLVAAEVRATMARLQVPGKALAEAMLTSTNSVSRRLRGITPFTLDELDQVAEFLGMPLSGLLDAAISERDRRAMADEEDRQMQAIFDRSAAEHGVAPTAIPISQRRAGANAEKRC